MTHNLYSSFASSGYSFIRHTALIRSFCFVLTHAYNFLEIKIVIFLFCGFLDSGPLEAVYF